MNYFQLIQTTHLTTTRATPDQSGLSIVPILLKQDASTPIIGQKFRLSALLTSLLTICFGFTSPFIISTAQAQQTATPIVKPLKNKSATEKTSSDSLPEHELSKELMFKLLSSDIAIQRGEWGSAFVTLLGVAQETRDPRIAKKAAEVAMGAQQINEALVAVNLWREISPDSFEASQYYLSLMVVKADFNEVEKHFKLQLKTIAKSEIPALLHQAQRLLARMQDKKTAFASLEKIVSSTTETLDTHIVLSRGAFASGDIERSAAEAKAALAIQANSELAILSLAQASSKEQAFQVVTDFLKQNPDSREVRFALATMLVENRQLEAAKKEFETILRDFEQHQISTARVIFTLGSIELELNHSDAAETYLLRYLSEADQEQDRNSAYINLAQVELQRKNTKGADAWLAKVENDASKNNVWFNIQMRRALLMASDQRFSEARQFLQTIKANSEAEEVLLLQTETQVMKAAGQQLEAFIVLQMALGDYPQSTDLLYDFAMLAENLKRFPEMELALKQLIAVAPDNSFAYNALGYSYADRNIQLDEAETLLKRAIELNPNDPYILDSLAWLRFRQKNYQQAEEILRRCLQLRRDPEIEIHLAEVLWTQEKHEEAKLLLNDARKKDPSNELLKSTLDRLDIKLP